jgi:ribosomal protein L30E
LVNQQLVSSVLKEAMKGGKYVLGTKEVVSSLKSAKAVLVTKSIASKYDERLTQEA